MQILANALPGFRALRAPVLAGYFWLLFAWLIVKPDVHDRPAGNMAAALYDLGTDVGHVGLVLSVSVAAYLVGAVSTTASSGLVTAWTACLGALWLALPEGFDRLALPPRSVRRTERPEVTRLRERVTASSIDAGPAGHDPRLVDEGNALFRQIDRELDLPATLLVGSQPELYAEVDRLRSEGEVRVAVVPPLSGLALLATVTVSTAWLIAILTIGLLLDQGARRISESQDLIADAIERGSVESLATKRYAAWIDQLPERTASGR
jgi:hypothetical protein